MIRYPIEQPPADGATLCIAPGIHWLRMPLPFVLSHINLWLLEDGEGWTLVDTGLDAPECRAAWERVLAEDLGDRLPGRVIATHLHPDHIGLAGWLCERYDVPLWMSREEYLLARVLVADTGHPAPTAGVRFYRAAGFTPEQLERYQRRFGLFGKVVAPLPAAYRRLRDGQQLRIGERHWEIVVGRGHSPEHACLYSATDRLLISGDQLLPTISSNVSVFPTEPEANPLADWLDSIDALRQRLPEDVLVLPAHGRPFHGAHPRLAELAREHLEALEALEGLCEKPLRAVDTFEVLFRGAVDERNLIMATGEAVAHLNYLLAKGKITRRRDADGVDWYRLAG